MGEVMVLMICPVCDIMILFKMLDTVCQCDLWNGSKWRTVPAGHQNHPWASQPRPVLLPHLLVDTSVCGYATFPNEADPLHTAVLLHRFSTHYRCSTLCLPAVEAKTFLYEARSECSLRGPVQCPRTILWQWPFCTITQTNWTLL